MLIPWSEWECCQISGHKIVNRRQRRSVLRDKSVIFGRAVICKIRFHIQEATNFHIPLFVKYLLPTCRIMLLIISPTCFGHNSWTSSGSQRLYRRTQLVWNFAKEMYLHLSLPHTLPHKLYTSMNLLAP